MNMENRPLSTSKVECMSLESTNRRRSLNARTFTLMMKMLMFGEYTKSDLVQSTGLNHATVSKYVTLMHEKRVVRVSGWRRSRNGRNWAPLWSMNQKETIGDVPKPLPLTSHEKYRRHKKLTDHDL